MDLLCQFCSKFPATKKCNTCIKHTFYCTSCFTELHNTPSMLTHRFSPMIGGKMLLENCLEHPSFPLKAICLDCNNQPICAECIAFGKHQGHSYKLIQEGLAGTSGPLSVDQVRQYFTERREQIINDIADYKKQVSEGFRKVYYAVGKAEKEWHEAMALEQKQLQSKLDMTYSLLKVIERGTKTPNQDPALFKLFGSGATPDSMYQGDLQEICRKTSSLKVVFPPVRTDGIEQELSELGKFNEKVLTPCTFAVFPKSKLCALYVVSTQKTAMIPLDTDLEERTSYVLSGNHIYFIGGFCYETMKPLGTTNAFSLYKGIMEEKEEMGTARFRIGLVSFHENKIYALGGDCEGQYTNVCERYDQVLNHWTPIPSLIEAQAGISAFFISTTIYAVGGYRENSTCSPCIEALDTLNEALGWKQIEIDGVGESMWTPITGCGAYAISEKEAVIFGGWKSMRKNLVFRLSVEGGRHSIRKISKVMPQAVEFSMGNNAVEYKGKVYAVDSVCKNVLIFNTSGETWDVVRKDNWIIEDQ